MDQRSFQKLLRRTVAIGVVLLMLLAATLVGEILLLSSSFRWVDHSDQVIANARQLGRYVVEMDSALRGYHLTKDTSFLDSYHESRARVPEQLALLERLTSDNPEQQARLAVVRASDLRWLEWGDQQLQLQGNSTDADLLRGQGLLNDLRAKQRDFVAAEETLRRERSHRTTALNGIVMGSAIALSFAVAALLFTLTRRELRELSSTYERHLHAEADKAREAKQSRELLQMTLRSLGEAAIATDGKGSILLLNPIAEQLTGWTEAEAVGRPANEVLRLSDERTRAELQDPLASVQRTREIIGLSNHIALINRQGQEFPVELNGAPILNDHGATVGAVVVFRDITQRRMTEQTLRSSERLTLAGRLSATIAHEIRNPLDTVTNLVYLLQHEPDQTSASSQFLNMASEELSRITQITSQLLTFHREARSPVDVDIAEVLESVLTLFAPQIRNQHIAVDQRFETNTPVCGYPGELRQVFSNLVGNAIEAMPKGGTLLLHVRDWKLALDHGRQGVRVTILDSGPGIPKGVRKNLFAPFYTTKGEKGTGLGLWVSRGIIEKHEGTIHLSSLTGVGKSGTAFSVFLPFRQKLGMLYGPEVPPAA